MKKATRKRSKLKCLDDMIVVDTAPITARPINAKKDIAAGIVYCFWNPSMPDLVKIGMTTRGVEERLAEANKKNTWQPERFECILFKVVDDAAACEKQIHTVLSDMGTRVNKRREFFRVSIDIARDVIERVVEAMPRRRMLRQSSDLVENMSAILADAFGVAWDDLHGDVSTHVDTSTHADVSPHASLRHVELERIFFDTKK